MYTHEDIHDLFDRNFSITIADLARVSGLTREEVRLILMQPRTVTTRVQPQKTLRPFFSYYGSKWRTIKRYPKPQHPDIREPFAGSASYSLHYPTHNVSLYDTDSNVCEVWDYLINAPTSEINSLPLFVENVDDLKIPAAARKLIGFWLNKGNSAPCKTPSKWMRRAQAEGKGGQFWGANIRHRIASQQEYIRHWEINQCSYANIAGYTSTYFIDPPYVKKGIYYRHSNIDYTHLSEWCQQRRGQVIVCENQGADWLPFKFLAHTKSTSSDLKKLPPSAEVIWTNDQ